MGQSKPFITAMVTATVAVVLAVAPASAECKRFGFTVNDYGKDGPTKDAKDLLGKLINKTMAEKGVKDFTTGKKSVSCELFLNFIVFDEHTCTAEANVCWGGSALPNGENADAADEPDKTKAAAADDTTPKHMKKKKKDDAANSEAPAEVKKSASEPVEKAVTEKTAATEHHSTEHHSKAKVIQVADPKPAPKPAATEAATSAPTPKSEESAKADDKTSSTPATETAKAPTGAPAAATANSDASPAKPDEVSKPKTDTAASDKSKSPVVTGSIAEPAKKVVKHKAEKPAKAAEDDGSPTPAGMAPGGSDAGYPTPMPPQPGDTPAPQ